MNMVEIIEKKKFGKALSADEIDSALRVSLSRYNDESDIDALLEGLSEATAALARRK